MSKLAALIKLLRKGEHGKLSEMLHCEPLNINELEAKTGKALLHLAIEAADEPAVALLTAFPGVDLDLPSREGELPLEMAVRLNDPALVGRLLELKADPRRRNGSGETVLGLALSQQTHREILKRLLQLVDPNERVAGHGSYLNLALAAPHAENFHLLLQQGARLTTKDDQDNTCLLLAVRGNRGDCVVAILERLAGDAVLSAVEKQFFFNAQNSEGNTALHEAVLRDLQTITQRLEAFGQAFGWDPSLRNKKGQTVEAIRAAQARTRAGEAEVERRRQEERVVRRREKEEEKLRLREEEEREQAEQKRLRREEQERAELAARVQSEAQKRQSLWIGAILLVVILGGMYLLLTNAIEKKKAPTF